MTEEELKSQILKTFNQYKERIELDIYQRRIEENIIVIPMIVIFPSGGHTWVGVSYNQDIVGFTHIEYRYNENHKTIEL